MRERRRLYSVWRFPKTGELIIRLEWWGRQWIRRTILAKHKQQPCLLSHYVSHTDMPRSCSQALYNSTIWDQDIVHWDQKSRAVIRCDYVDFLWGHCITLIQWWKRQIVADFNSLFIPNSIRIQLRISLPPIAHRICVHVEFYKPIANSSKTIFSLTQLLRTGFTIVQTPFNYIIPHLI